MLEPDIDIKLAYQDLREELGEALDMRDYYRRVDVPEAEKAEAIAAAELVVAVAEAAASGGNPAAIAKVVEASTKATTAASRVRRRKRDLRRREMQIDRVRARAEALDMRMPF